MPMAFQGVERVDDPQESPNGSGAAVRTATGNAAEMRAATETFINELVGRFSFAQAHGLTFDGKRDLYTQLGYRKSLTPADMRERYNRGDIAQRIVEAYPKATWTSLATIYEDEDPDVKTKFEEGVEDLEQRLSLWSRLLRADILCGLGHYSIRATGCRSSTSASSPIARADAARFTRRASSTSPRACSKTRCWAGRGWKRCGTVSTISTSWSALAARRRGSAWIPACNSTSTRTSY
jgi:hypothetical protein